MLEAAAQHLAGVGQHHERALVDVEDQLFQLIRLMAADDDEQMTFEGKEIDLAQLALTLTVLELPMRFECESCSDRSDEEDVGEETRACQKETPMEHPFSALQQLLTKDQEV